MSFTASSHKNTSPERTFSFQAIVRNENTDSGSPSLLEWIGSNELVSLKKSNTDTSNQTSREIIFSLSETVAVYFPLLKGILASAKSQWFVLRTDDGSKSFALRYDKEREIEVRDLLFKVLGIVDAEARFKQVLRKVIVNQEKFNREEKLLFKELGK